MKKARFTLGPPEYQNFKVPYEDSEGEEKELVLRLRVFTFADVGWLYNEAGEDWYDIILTTGNSNLAIEILAHQIDNEGELRQLMGNVDLTEGLKQYIPMQENALVGVMEILLDLFQKAMPLEQKKKMAAKKKAARLKILRTGLIALLFACLGLAAGLYHSGTFTI